MNRQTETNLIAANYWKNSKNKLSVVIAVVVVVAVVVIDVIVIVVIVAIVIIVIVLGWACRPRAVARCPRLTRSCRAIS